MSTNYAGESTVDTVAAPQIRSISLPRTIAMSRVRLLELTLLIVAGVLLVVSIAQPYWSITLRAPQYPRGLAVDVYVNKMQPEKNVREVDGLNHYIGMIKLTDAAKIEREVSLFGLPLLALLAVASWWLRGVWRWVTRVPIIVYPVVFVADLFGWLYYAGHSLDPHAALSSSIDEFTPRLYGTGTIGQFRTEATFDRGFYFALAAAAVVLIASLIGRGKRHATA